MRHPREGGDPIARKRPPPEPALPLNSKHPSASKRRSLAASGDGCVIPAKAGIQRRASALPQNRRSRRTRRIGPRARGAAAQRLAADASSPPPPPRGQAPAGIQLRASAHVHGGAAAEFETSVREQAAHPTAVSGRAQRDRRQRPSPPRRRGPSGSSRVTQARDTATPHVRFARVDTGSVIPSNARDPGVGAAEIPRLRLGMTKGDELSFRPCKHRFRHPEQREGSRHWRGGDSSPTARNDKEGTARDDKEGAARNNEERRLGIARSGGSD
jgi:hypothetical protein